MQLLKNRQGMPSTTPSMPQPTSSSQSKKPASLAATEATTSKPVDKPLPNKIIPVVPILQERVATPKEQITESAIPTASPGAESSQAATSPEKDRDVKPRLSQSVAATSDALSQQVSEPRTLEGDSKATKVSTKAGGKRPHPGNIDISKAISLPEKDLPSSATAGPLKSESLARKRAPSLTSSASSRPGTPAAIATGSPIRRVSTLARTLRITGTPSVETPTSVSSGGAVGSSTSTAQPVSTPAAASTSKVSSRRPSVSSLNAPGTPVSEHVDSISLASASVSRANSPPPIGTNKKAEKKTRKQKQKQAQPEVEAVLVRDTTEEQAPILSRKKKAKKPADGPAAKRTVTSSSTPQVSRPSSPKLEEKDEVVEHVKLVEPEQLDTAEVETPTDAVPETPATPPEPEPPQPSATNTEKEKEKPLTPAAILRALESTHQLALSTLALLKPLTETKGRNWLVDQSAPASSSNAPSITGASGNLSFTTADLHNHLDQLAFEITRAEAELLRRGRALRRDTGDGRISGRNLVTPDGARFACLTKDEEDRAEALSAAIASSKGVARWRGAFRAHAAPRVRIAGDVPPSSSSSAAPQSAASAPAPAPARDEARRLPRPPPDDVAAYVNAFVPPGADGAAAPLSSSAAGGDGGSAARGADAAFTAEAYQRAEQVLENVTRQIEAGVKAAQGRDPGGAAMGELAEQVGHGIERAIGAYGGIGGGYGAVAPAGKEKVSVKEAEQLLGEARKAAEVWERKLNAVVKRNRKLVFGGRE